MSLIGRGAAARHRLGVCDGLRGDKEHGGRVVFIIAIDARGRGRAIEQTVSGTLDRNGGVMRRSWFARLRVTEKKLESACDTVSGCSRIAEGHDDASAPDGIRVERSARGLRITRRWFTGSEHVMLGWAVVWFGLLSIFLSLGGHPLDRFNLIPAAPGVGMAYAAIAHYLNHTLIDVSRSHLAVRHAALPWPGGKNFATRDIDRVCGETRKVHAKGHTVDARRIMMVRKNGGKKPLLSGLELSEYQMDFIVEAINEYLQALPGTRSNIGNVKPG